MTYIEGHLPDDADLMLRVYQAQRLRINGLTIIESVDAVTGHGKSMNSHHDTSRPAYPVPQTEWQWWIYTLAGRLRRVGETVSSIMKQTRRPAGQ